MNVILILFALIGTAGALPTAPLWIHDSNGNLGTYDFNSGIVTVIGNMGPVMTDIAYDPSGNLFGITFSSLYSIDPTTAGTSLIGSHRISGGNARVFGSDGTWYGAGHRTPNLFSIDVTTGTGTELGNMGVYVSR